MITKIASLSEENLKIAVELLKKGEVIGIPTETVYGLGAVGINPTAVKKIFEVKGRPADNPLIAHVHKNYDLNELVYIEHDYVYKLLKAYTPGPLTLVFKSKRVVCDEATCGGETLAVRIPSHTGCQRLLELLNLPVVAPSANLSKHTSPVTAEHVYNDLNGKIPFILDGGKCSGGIESTVLDVTEKVPRILRAGLITKEMVEQTVGACLIAEHKEGDKVKSPGVKYKHYRPKCQTALFSRQQVEEIKQEYQKYINKNLVPYIMCDEDMAKNFIGYNILNLGKTEEEIASNLYYKLLEGEKIADIIIAIEMPNEKGIYLGITNRLKKSCG